MPKLDIGVVLNERFELVAKLGKGGFGEVWHAKDKTLGRDVAIKRIMGHDAGSEAVDEARKLASLEHSNIVKVYDVFEADLAAFIVMELVEGESLADLLRAKALEGDWIGLDQAATFFEQTAEALAHAHQKSIVHRDIKPENILISTLGEAKLTDFGIAKQENKVDGFGASNNVSVDGARTGTFEYMSPEQLSGKSLDYRTDVFSLGLVAYLLFTRRHPFIHESGLYSIDELILEEGYDPEPVVFYFEDEPHVSQLIEEMLARDIDKRIQNVGEVLAVLRTTNSFACENCGSPNGEEAMFCGQCGNNLGVETPEPDLPENSPASLTNEGYSFARSGDWRTAIARYREAIGIDPSFSRAHGNLGYALNRLGNYEEAIEVLDTAISLAPHPSCYDYRAFALGKLRRNDEALESLNMALDLSPANLNIMLHRARILMFLDRFVDAGEQVGEILIRDPENRKALNYQSQIQDRLGGGS